MAYPSEKEIPHSPEKPGYGVRLFEKAFHFYSWYLSYDLFPQNHTEIFEMLSSFMQIAKISFQGANLLSKQEETLATKELDDILEALSNGFLKNKDLFKALEKSLNHLIESNPHTKVVRLLMKLEYKLCIYNKDKVPPSFQEAFKNLSDSALTILSSQVPTLIAKTLCRELESLHKNPLSEENFFINLKESLSLLHHRY